MCVVAVIFLDCFCSFIPRKKCFWSLEGVTLPMSHYGHGKGKLIEGEEVPLMERRAKKCL